MIHTKKDVYANKTFRPIFYSGPDFLAQYVLFGLTFCCGKIWLWPQKVFRLKNNFSQKYFLTQFFFSAQNHFLPKSFFLQDFIFCI